MGIFTGILGFILTLNGIVIVLISVLLGFFSNFYFGFGILVLGFLVLVTTPELNVRVGQNDWTFGIPVFPGKGFVRLVFGVTIVCSILFAVFAGESKQPLTLKGVNFVSQKFGQSRIYLVEDSWVYYRKGNEIVSKNRVSREEVFLLETNIAIDNGEKFALVMFKNKEGIFFGGREAYVPVSALKELPSPKTSAVQKSDRGRNKFQVGAVVLNSEEIARKDLFGDSPDKLKLFIPGFKNGDVVEFQEDFWIKTVAGQIQGTIMFMFADNKQKKSFGGGKIPQGTTFHVRGEKGVELLFFSKGRTQVGFSDIVLRKIN